MKRTELKRKQIQRQPVERKRSPLLPGTGRGVHAPSSDVPVASMPKREYVRSAALREAYRLIPCMWAGCGIEDGTVCCAHSNWHEHGKGGGIKADDSRGAALCSVHHAALDQGSVMSYEERKAGWTAAHGRSVRELLGRGLWPKDVPVPADAAGLHVELWFQPRGFVFV